MSTELSLGFSSCPNDTFIFHAMLHGEIDTYGIRYTPYIADVEELNRKAFAADLDITKLSYHAFAYVNKNYLLLNAGSALGRGCGPLLISKHPIEKPQVALKNLRIAIPGKYTTANFLLGLYAPDALNKVEMLFSDIEDAVLNGTVDAGLIIHENRFTYEQRGLQKIVDLGEYWETTTSNPIPLGGIVVNKRLPKELQLQVDDTIKRSVDFAFKHPEASKEYVKLHAQAMSEEVMYKHIGLYVNEYSVNLGVIGRSAINTLYQKAQALNIVPIMDSQIFVNN